MCARALIYSRYFVVFCCRDWHGHLVMPQSRLTEGEVDRYPEASAWCPTASRTQTQPYYGISCRCKEETTFWILHCLLSNQEFDERQQHPSRCSGSGPTFKHSRTWLSIELVQLRNEAFASTRSPRCRRPPLRKLCKRSAAGLLNGDAKSFVSLG